jgi:hypothetical protein
LSNILILGAIVGIVMVNLDLFQESGGRACAEFGEEVKIPHKILGFQRFSPRQPCGVEAC